MMYKKYFSTTVLQSYTTVGGKEMSTYLTETAVMASAEQLH